MLVITYVSVLHQQFLSIYIFRCSLLCLIDFPRGEHLHVLSYSRNIQLVVRLHKNCWLRWRLNGVGDAIWLIPIDGRDEYVEVVLCLVESNLPISDMHDECISFRSVSYTHLTLPTIA